ncbi:MAG: 4'-phosphopantetheinyl transferase superfamily protein [Gemmatimonadota bacterium]
MLTVPERMLATEIDGGSGVRVWCARVDLSPEEHGALHALLSPDERMRAATYPGTIRGARFVSARGMLRQLLAHVIGVSAHAIRFAYGVDGKPSLGDDLAASGIEFNLSHARDVAVFAITRGRAVGIDVASTGGVMPIEKLMARFFSAEERAAVADAPPEERREAFSRIWVRKEAYLKGRGEGISQWAYRTDFSDPTGRRALAPPPRVERDQDAWDVRDLRGVPPGFVGSVALSRQG